MKRRARLRRRGVALLMAVMLIAVVGAVLSALTISISAEAKRTMRHAEDAQLRQLLLAGQFAAQTSNAQTPSGEVTLPPELKSAGMSVRYEMIGGASADGKLVRILARDGNGRKASQTLRFAKTGDGHFELRAAEL
jgi:hypothetical protein